MVMRRRRGVDEDAVIVPQDMVATPEDALFDRQVQMPLIHAAPVVERPQPVASATAMTPAGSLAAGSLEAMVAAPPSADNPFLTMRARIRRAKFLLERQELASPPAPALAVDPAPASTAAKPVDRSQTVYRFGQGDGRSRGLIPRTR
jgi:hypothetical protein